MVVGRLLLRIMIPGARSLKDKRRALRSIRDRLRVKFNVSVAEVAAQDVWQTAVLGVCAVGAERSYVDGLLNQVESLVRTSRNVELARTEKDFL